MKISDVLEEFITTGELSNKAYDAIAGYSRAVLQTGNIRREDIISMLHEALYGIRKKGLSSDYSKGQRVQYFRYELYTARHKVFGQVYKHTDSVDYYRNLDELGMENEIKNVDFTESLLKLFAEVLTYKEYVVIYQSLIEHKLGREIGEYIGVNQQQVSKIFRAAKEKLRKYLSNYY